MNTKQLVKATSIGVASGFAGTKVMEPVMGKLQDLKSAATKERENRATPGQPTEIAAEKTARLLHVQLTDAQRKKAAMAFHYSVGITGGLIYTVLRQTTRLNPVTAGLASGLSLWAVFDEALNPLFGFTGKPQEYPAATHISALAGHLVYGLGVAACAESLRWLVRRNLAR